MTGNTVIDAFWMWSIACVRAELKASLDQDFSFLDASKRLILVTGHRRESFGAGFREYLSAH